jgi:hypothetical protein
MCNPLPQLHNYRRTKPVTAKANPEVPAVVPGPSGAVSGSQLPPELARRGGRVGCLPQAIKAAVLALVQAAAGPGDRS